MKPTRENYEIWCIDYLDGKLSSDEVADFMLFLAENRDLSDEFDGIRSLDTSVSTAEPIVSFTHLKKEFSEEQLDKNTFDEFCIAFYEGDLEDKEIKRLKSFISAHPEFMSRFEAYKELTLEADLSIKYPNKKQLKRTIPFYRYKIYKYILPIAAAAAVIAILIRTPENPGIQNIEDLHSSAKSAISPHDIIEVEAENSSVQNEQMAEQNTAKFPVQETKKSSEQSVTNNAIAVFDTTTDRPDIFIPSIAFHKQNILISSQVNQKIIIPTTALHSPPSGRIEEFLEMASIRSYQVRNILFNPTLDKMLQKSVDGINQIAETDLKYHSDTDENGRLLAFALTSERFNFKRKMRSN